MKKVLILSILILFTAAGYGQRQYSFAKKTAYSVDAASTINLTLQNTETVVTVPVESACTINITNTSKLYPGDRLTLIIVADSIWRITAGTRMQTGYYTTPAAGTYTISCSYDGTRFYYNVLGTKGATGATGATGPTGATGAAGTPCDTTKYPTIFSVAGDTTGVAPNKAGDIFINTTGGKVYIGKEGVRGGWLILNGFGLLQIPLLIAGISLVVRRKRRNSG